MQGQGRKNRDIRALESVQHYLIRVVRIIRELQTKRKTLFSTHNHNFNNIGFFFLGGVRVDDNKKYICKDGGRLIEILCTGPRICASLSN